MMIRLVRLAVFMLCCQLLVFFRPKESYEKFFRLLVNIMIIIQFLIPVAGLLSSERRVDLQREAEKFMLLLEQTDQKEWTAYTGEEDSTLGMVPSDGEEGRTIWIDPVVIERTRIEAEVEDGS